MKTKLIVFFFALIGIFTLGIALHEMAHFLLYLNQENVKIKDICVLEYKNGAVGQVDYVTNGPYREHSEFWPSLLDSSFILLSLFKVCDWYFD